MVLTFFEAISFSVSCLASSFGVICFFYTPICIVYQELSNNLGDKFYLKMPTMTSFRYKLKFSPRVHQSQNLFQNGARIGAAIKEMV